MATEKRLIDANALFAEIDRRFCLNCNFYDGKCQECQYAEVADMLLDAPTVDAVEVVHGRWEQVCFEVYRCSACSEEQFFTSNYCHNCGAKMDGGADNV